MGCRGLGSFRWLLQGYEEFVQLSPHKVGTGWVQDWQDSNSSWAPIFFLPLTNYGRDLAAYQESDSDDNATGIVDLEADAPVKPRVTGLQIVFSIASFT